MKNIRHIVSLLFLLVFLFGNQQGYAYVHYSSHAQSNQTEQVDTKAAASCCDVIQHTNKHNSCMVSSCAIPFVGIVLNAFDFTNFFNTSYPSANFYYQSSLVSLLGQTIWYPPKI